MLRQPSSKLPCVRNTAASFCITCTHMNMQTQERSYGAMFDTTTMAGGAGLFQLLCMGNTAAAFRSSYSHTNTAANAGSILLDCLLSPSACCA
jgi:hypothetical protein